MGKDQYQRGVAVRDMPEREGCTLGPLLHSTWVGRQVGRTEAAWASHFCLRTSKNNGFSLLGKLPSNKKPLGQLREEKGVKAGAPVDPNRLNQPISCTTVGLCVDYITFIIPPSLLHVEHLKDRNILFFLRIPRPDR